MIHVLCFEPHLKVVVSAHNLKFKDFLDKKNNYVNSIDLKLTGAGIDAARILAAIDIPSRMIGLVSKDNHQIITEKIEQENIELIEIATNLNSQIDVQIETNNEKKFLIAPNPPHANVGKDLLNEVVKLNKYDVLIVPGETEYSLILDICKTCSENMVNFYFDFKDYYDKEILELNPFLVSFDINQLGKIIGYKINQSNIFTSLDELSDFGVENAIVISKNTVFVKFKSHAFSVFCEGFSELNQSVNKEMLVSAFIGLLASNPEPKKAIYEAIEITRDFTFNISKSFSRTKNKKIHSFLEKLEMNRNFSDKFELTVYENTKELVFSIAKNQVLNNSIENAIIQKIEDFFCTKQVKIRTSFDLYYFHFKIFQNNESITNINRLKSIAETNSDMFFKIILEILKK